MPAIDAPVTRTRAVVRGRDIESTSYNSSKKTNNSGASARVMAHRLTGRRLSKTFPNVRRKAPPLVESHTPVKRDGGVVRARHRQAYTFASRLA